MRMHELGPVSTCGMRAWQKCLVDVRYYVMFMVKPAIGPKPRLAVVDDYGNLMLV